MTSQPNLVFYLNQKRVQLHQPDPTMTLYEYLRRQGLFGARIAEGQGTFGTDVVTVASWDGHRVVYRSVGALKTPLVRVHGKQVFTVEGIGSRAVMHPIQQQFVDCESFQCGFCAGGFTMSMYTMLRNIPQPKEADILQALDGNMCRCTAFGPIAAAVAAFATDIEDMKICQNKVKLDCDKEIPFPNELKTLSPVVNYAFETLSETDGSRVLQVEYFTAKTVEELSHIKCEQTLLLSSATSHMLRTQCDPTKATRYVVADLKEIAELKHIEISGDKLKIGSQVTYTELIERLQTEKSPVLQKIAQHLLMFRNTPLRNVQTIGSQFVAAGDNDFNLFMAAMGAKVQLLDLATKATAEQSVETLKVAKDQLVLSVTAEVPEFIELTKRSRRHANMESIVACCVAVNKDKCHVFVNHVSEDRDIAGLVVSKAEFLAPETHLHMRALLDGKFAFDKTETPENRIYGVFRDKITSNNAFLIQCRYKLDHKLPVSAEYEAALLLAENNTTYGKGLKLPRVERIIPESYRKIAGHPINSQTQKAKISGDPLYSMDLDEFSNQITHGAYVMTDRSFGKVLSVDISQAKLVPGFVGYVDERDIPNKKNGNTHSGIQFDTPVFVKNGEVLHMSQPVGLVTATTREQAQLAARLVKVHYDTDDKAVFQEYIDKKKKQVTIEEAMINNSYLPNCGVNQRFLTLGDGAANVEKSDIYVQGSNSMGGQDHVYFETHNCIVYLTNNGGMKVFSSTQNPSKMQFDIAWNLNNPDHEPADKSFIKQEDFIQNAQIEVEVMQLGGGFGGKQDRPMILCTAAAVAAHVTGRSVKLTLNRDQDLVTMGGRHPYYFEYKAGLTKEGKYTAMDLLLVQDGGSTYDCSGPVLDKSIFQSQSCYTIPNIRVEGRSAKTNRVTNTAYRGFGAPQATFVQETIVDHLAQVWYQKYGQEKFKTFQEAAFYIREINMNKKGDLMLSKTLISTEYAEHLTQTLYKTLMARSQVETKFREVAEFNAKNKWIKRGIACTPLKNSVNFEENFMNQASALIHIYRDGSVALSHSGIEMGQSLHTKMAMVAAEVLQIPLEYIRVINTNTQRCPNTQPTAASSGADINGKAVRMACEELMGYMKEMREKLAGKSWPDICNICYFNRIRLTAQSFATHPHEIEWSWNTKTGCSGFYTAYGIALSIVEVNGLTGEFQVLEQFMQKDVGSPLNPLIDCGQIEGGFGMGYGLLTTEEILWEGGLQLTKSSNYAIGTMVDMPKFSSVEIQKDVPNPANIFDSKASAESPVCLGAAVFFAIKNAIRELRAASGKPLENAVDKAGNKYLKAEAPLSYRRIFEVIEE